MSCARYDELLALQVEGDLAPAEARVLEAHLDACGRCRTFLQELRSSQGRLRAAAADELDVPALAVVRDAVARELEVAASSRAFGLAAAWRWGALAAGVLVAAWIAQRLARPPAPASSVATAVAAPSPAALTVPSPRAPAPDPASSAHSTPRRRAKVSDRKGHAPAYGLSEDDADQLARAVVALAQAEGEPSEGEHEPGAAMPPLVRIVTADPDVVIYWQLESNGG